MTLREWYAGQAMAALLGYPEAPYPVVAQAAVAAADALIAALEEDS
jgi:hypothetical protein